MNTAFMKRNTHINECEVRMSLIKLIFTFDAIM